MTNKYDPLPDAIKKIAWLILVAAILSIITRIWSFAIYEHSFKESLEFIFMNLTFLIQPLFYFCIALALARLVRQKNQGE